MKELGTLRELLLKHSSKAQLGKVLDYLFDKDKRSRGTRTRRETVASYTPVIVELLRKPLVSPHAMPFLVTWRRDPGERYVDVCLLNTEYKAPPRGLRPWGCVNKEPPPNGHYDCNDSKHHRYFAIECMKWSELIDTPILDESGLLPHEILAEILWELTYSGWSEGEREAFWADLKARADHATKELLKEIAPKTA